jgi:hypothetical protein
MNGCCYVSEHGETRRVWGYGRRDLAVLLGFNSSTIHR